MRRLAFFATVGWFLGSLALAIWTASQNPFAQPLVARSAEQVRLAIERAIALQVTPGWLLPRLSAAIAADEPDRVTMFLALADDHAIPLPAETRAAADAVLAARAGFVGTATACGRCAVDIASCASLRLLSVCAIPFELSPAGDVSALGRAGYAWMTGSDVDDIEAGLAAVGLGATVATLASGGTSMSMKLGATVLRVGRKIGALRPAMLDAIRQSVTRAGDEATLAAIATDFGRLRDSTSSADALTLLRYAEGPADLSRLVRISEAAGPRTGAVLEVLGKARTFRLLNRVNNLALLAVGLATLLGTQLASALLSLLPRLFRPLTRPRRRRRTVA